MQSLRLLFPALLVGLLLFPGCGPCDDCVPLEASFQPVGFSILATDSLGRPIEGVQVRILEGWQEWDGETYPALGPLRRKSTGPRGLADFDAYDLGQSGLGFATTLDGDAILYDIASEDEAVVTIEVGSPSLGWVELDIPLSFERPYNEIFLTY